MSLENWLNNGWLRQEPSTAEEVEALLSIVGRAIADARVEAISTDLRFSAAFNAVLTSATIALRAAGCRVPAQAGHHVGTI